MGWIKMAGKGVGLIEWREYQGYVLGRRVAAALVTEGKVGAFV